MAKGIEPFADSIPFAEIRRSQSAGLSKEMIDTFLIAQIKMKDGFWDSQI